MPPASGSENPVTLRGRDSTTGVSIAVCVSRMHIGEPADKLVPIVMYVESVPCCGVPDADKILGTVIVDEEHFVDKLCRLFPDSGLSHMDCSAPPVNRKLRDSLTIAVDALRRLGASHESLEPLEAVLKSSGV